MIACIKNKIQKLTSDEKFSEILTGSSWALVAKLLATAVGFITTIVIVRIYGAEVLGIVALLNSFLMLVTIFTVLGTDTAVLRLMPEYFVKYSPTAAFNIYKKIQYTVVLMSLTTSVTFFLASDFIATVIFRKPDLSIYFAIGAVFVLMQSLIQLNTQSLRGLRLIKTFALMQLLPSVSKLVVLLMLTFWFFNYDNPVYALFVSVLITALFGSWVIYRAFNKFITNEDEKKDIPLRRVLAISLPMFMNKTIVLIIGQTGIIMLGVYRTEAEVGYYSVSIALATLVVFFISVINSMAASKFSELYHTGKMDDLFYVAKKSAKLIFWTTTPVALVLVVLGRPFLLIFYGQDFTIAYHSMLLLIAGQFVVAITGSTGTFMNMTGSHKTLLIINVLSMTVNVLICLTLIPSYGIYGAALAAMGSMFFLNITSLLFIKTKYGKTIAYLPWFASV